MMLFGRPVTLFGRPVTPVRHPVTLRVTVPVTPPLATWAT
jgi:hypothetical protein